MRAKATPASRRRANRAVQHRVKSARSATTYRLDPHYQKGLALIGQVRKMSLNKMVNEAVGEYLESRAALLEADLQETLRRVKMYREKDPNFEAAISKFAEAEAALAKSDPVEGTASEEPAPGPAQTLVRDLIRG